MIKSDEVDDIFCILEASFRKKNSKGMLTCLEILNSQSLCPTAYLKHIPENYHRIVLAIASLKQISEDSDYYDEESVIQDISANKTLASNLLVRISSASRAEDLDERSPGMRPFGDTVNINERKFEKPSSLKTCLFQLSESNDIDRVVFLLDDILNSHMGKLDYLTTSNFPKILMKVILRYANGDFGFENSDNVKYCIFQNRMIKSLLAIIYHNQDLIFDISSEVLSALAQIIEECCMYIVENISNYDKKHEYEYKTAFVQSLELFELLLTNHSKENIAEVTTAIRNIIQRINMYFSQQSEEDCDTDELGVFYDDLKAYYQDMKKLLMKTETLTNIYDSSVKTKSRMASYATFNKENYVK